MTKRKIVIEPDPILRKKSEIIQKVDTDLRRLMDDMLETMYAAPGIGLAAVQVGVLKRVVVIDVSKEKEKKNPLFLINPQIISKSDQTSVYEEGCLSIALLICSIWTRRLFPSITSSSGLSSLQCSLAQR